MGAAHAQKNYFLCEKMEQETIRIYLTESMLDNLIDLNFVQWFLDGT